MSLKRRLWIKLRLKLPRVFFYPPIAYLLLDHIEPYLYMDNWSSLPLNGQARRMRVVADISQKLEVGAVIETGTYLGSSTSYLAGIFGCKTYTMVGIRLTTRNYDQVWLSQEWTSPGPNKSFVRGSKTMTTVWTTLIGCAGVTPLCVRVVV